MTQRLKQVDVVIVGLGWAGAIMAKELAQTGLSMVALERGGAALSQADPAAIASHDDLAITRRLEQRASLALSTVTVRNTIDEVARPMRRHGPFPWGDGVGGSGVLWAANSWRLSPWDFRPRSSTIERYGAAAIPADCTMADWPISHAELEPFYDRFERDIGVGGKAGNIAGRIVPGGNPFESPRARDYPNPPAPETYQQKLFADATRALGYHPFPLPGATMTQEYTNPSGVTLNQCMYCGHCAGFSCEMNAKAMPQNTVLPTALASKRLEVRTRTTVTRINLDSTGTRATGVTYVDAAGREFEQPAEIVILAAFTFPNVQLLLSSGIGTPYDPVTNTGQIGRNFVWHSPYPRTTLFFEQGHVFNRYGGAGSLGTRIHDFYGDNFDHAGLGFIGGGAIGVGAVGSSALEMGIVPKGTPPFGSAWKAAVHKWADRTMGMSAMHDCPGYRGNYLSLDPTYRDAHGLPLLRVTYDFQPNEHTANAFLLQRMEEIARQIGPTLLQSEGMPRHWDAGAQYRSIHQSGGAICGTAPENSAVNDHLQIWGTPNLFVVGSTAFPQLPAANPTMHMGALAYRTADSIRQRYLARPGLLS